MTNPALQEVIALLGHPAAGTPAQYLFERVVVGDSLDWRFVTLEVQPGQLAAALGGLDAMNFRGCLLAGGLQQPAAELLSVISPAAQFAGGCSLLERTPDGLSGHLTLGRGLLEAVRLHADPAASPTVIVGSGLLARATALELTLAGVPEIIVVDPWDDAGDSLVKAIAGIEGGQASLIVLFHWLPLLLEQGCCTNEGGLILVYLQTLCHRETGLLMTLLMMCRCAVEGLQIAGVVDHRGLPRPHLEIAQGELQQVTGAADQPVGERPAQLHHQLELLE